MRLKLNKLIVDININKPIIIKDFDPKTTAVEIKIPKIAFLDVVRIAKIKINKVIKNNIKL